MTGPSPFDEGYIAPEPQPDTFREDFGLGDPKPRAPSAPGIVPWDGKLIGATG